MERSHSTETRLVVIDTNVWLDLLVFEDVSVTPLFAAVHARLVRRSRFTRSGHSGTPAAQPQGSTSRPAWPASTAWEWNSPQHPTAVSRAATPTTRNFSIWPSSDAVHGW